jgi:peptidyl-prolyl cis-trans isomerase A (cyclophilin A)
MLLRSRSTLSLLLYLALLVPLSASAGTVVRVNTSLGDFYLELYDEVTPITVNNFLSYVNGGLYNDTIVHRLAQNFVIQGGGYTFYEDIQFFYEIEAGNPIVNEPRRSNLRGTIAMAKLPGNPHSATNQWFINLGNNTFLDNDNGGYSVFGHVLGDGMNVVNAIAGLQPVRLITGWDFFPTRNYTTPPLRRDNLVYLNMEVAGSTDGVVAEFKPGTGRLRTFVDAGALGLMSVEMVLTSEDPQLIVKLDPTRMFPLPQRLDTMSVFNNNTGELTIPEIYVNGEVMWRNVRFQLTDEQQLVFTLTGLE